ncbi:MAG: acyl--CoA ligase [Clostridiales bacterium]|nr:acyl--CoA ligase [Clostridiales bacterium]
MFRSIPEAVFAHAAAAPGKLCLADETRSVTYREYAEEILKTAAALRSKGVGSDDKVLIEASQTISFCAAAMAVQLLGGVFVPVERNCGLDKILRIASLSGAKLVITPKALSEIPENAACMTASALIAEAAAAEPIECPEMPAAETMAELLFSTGTTGTEKGIAISHGNNVALAGNVIEGVSILEDNIELIPSPLNHSHGLRRYYANMYAGASVVLITGVMNVRMFFELMDRYRVNSIDLVPTALSVLLKLSRGQFGLYKDILRYIQFGSAPLVAQDMQTIRSLLPDTRLYNFYGSTESGCIVIYDFNTDHPKDKCIGRPACNARIIIVDEDRNEIASAPDNTGCIASFGPMNMMGYWQDPEETRRVMENGFIYSNDEAYFDEDGDIILLGRRGDVINTGGNKVSPSEIEDAALKIEAVADCGCIAVADPMKGQVPKLYVQLKAGCTFDPISLRNDLAARLEPYKVPAFIEAIDAIPRSFNGKILRRVLSEIHAKKNH